MKNITVAAAANSPFSARRELQEQYDTLRGTIENTLKKMSALQTQRKKIYGNYIEKLRKVLPCSVDTAMNAKEIARAMGFSGEEYDSLRHSLEGLATGAVWARYYDVQARHKGDRTYDYHDHCALVELCGKWKQALHHIGELDENGNVISTWDEEHSERVYWLEKDWQKHPESAFSPDDEDEDEDDEDEDDEDEDEDDEEDEDEDDEEDEEDEDEDDEEDEDEDDEEDED